MLKKIFSFFLLSFLFFSPHAMASTNYKMPDFLLEYINNLTPTLSAYTSIKNDGTSTNDSLFSIVYYDENNKEQTLYFNVYNGASKVTPFGTRLTNPTSDINSNFIGLAHTPTSGTDQGGAIYNFSSIRGDIRGDFIGNYVYYVSSSFFLFAQGGAIYNYNNSTISNIIGDFIGNYAYLDITYMMYSPQGGAIYNSSTISNITGNFIGNYAASVSNSAYGGAIYNNNNSTISNITGNFIGNYASSTNGTASGGAIYNLGTISFLADNRTSYFTDNYTFNGTDKTYNAIYNAFRTLTFSMQGNGSFVMNDSITGAGGSSTINIEGQNANNNIFYLNDSISGNIVNLDNATLKLGYYTHENGTVTSGYSSDTTATINFTNNSLLNLDLIDFDYSNKSILSGATLDFDSNTALTIRNADLGDYTIGSSITFDTNSSYSSASSLHSMTKTGTTFSIEFDPTSTLISNSQLGDFMDKIGNDFSAKSTSSANRFIFQASQIGTDTKKQAAIVDGTAQLSAMGASNALARSAISAKQDSINTRISQTLAYNVENLIASNGNIEGIITPKKNKDISLWLMPYYNHDRVSGMDSGSFSHAYTSHLFGLALGADKTFNPATNKYINFGLALDTGVGLANTRDDIENIKNEFINYGATAYASLALHNLMLSVNGGHQISDNEVRLNMGAYNALEDQDADITSHTSYASIKAVYDIEMLYFYHSREVKKQEAAEVARLQAEQEEQKAEELAMRENAEDPENLPEPTVYEEIADYEMPSFFQMLYGKTHRKNSKYTIKENFDRTMSFSFTPYIGLDFMTINSNDYEVYSTNSAGNKDVTFSVESERQNIFTIPLGIQIKPELAVMTNFKVSPQVKLGLAYSFGDLTEKSTSTAKGISAIAHLETENIDAFRGDFGISANVKPIKLDNINFDIGYDLEVSKNRFVHDVSAKVEFKF